MRTNAVPTARLAIALAAIIGLFGVVSWRLFSVAVIHHQEYSKTATSQASFTGGALIRGDILISDESSGREYLIATVKRYTTVAIVPSELPDTDKGTVLETLARVLELEPESITDALSEGGRRRVIARRISDEAAATLRDAELPGVELIEESGRSYPAGDLAADVLGFFGYTAEGQSGQYGIEASYEENLSGRSVDSHSRWGFLGNLAKLVGYGNAEAPPESQDVILSIDRNIQTYVQQALAALIQQYGAASGTIIVQVPQTGQILALADAPTYKPESYGSYAPETYPNGALTPFEPGSSFKPFTMAIGLEKRAVKPETVFNDNKDIVVDGYTIRNFNGQHFGRVTMTQVLEKSINAGTMYVQSLLSQDDFLSGIVDMGFGQVAGIELPNESPGDLDNLYSGRRINFMTASFGQGITVTPLQLIAAYSAIANGGRLMRPHIVAAVRNEDGTDMRTEPEVLGTPFTEKTAHQLRDMLVSVVDNGFDKARIARYDVAGKTGTAQIASPEGGYVEGEYNHSFVGFAPASNAQFTILIKLERPHGVIYAADSLSLPFRDIARFLLNYLNVSPTR